MSCQTGYHAYKSLLSSSPVTSAAISKRNLLGHRVKKDAQTDSQTEREAWVCRSAKCHLGPTIHFPRSFSAVTSEAIPKRNLLGHITRSATSEICLLMILDSSLITSASLLSSSLQAQRAAVRDARDAAAVHLLLLHGPAAHLLVRRLRAQSQGRRGEERGDMGLDGVEEAFLTSYGLFDPPLICLVGLGVLPR